MMGMLKLLFEKVVLCRDRACPCPNFEADSHKGCPYETSSFPDQNIPEIFSTVP
jgi:hypothetical protein